MYYTLFASLAIFLGLINSTKQLDGDIVVYKWLFMNLPKQHLWDAVFNSKMATYQGAQTGKEPIYNLISYIGYYLTFGRFSLYICALTFTSYYLQFIGIFKLFYKLKSNHLTILLSIIALSCFTQYFSLTAHLIRQVLACSIFMYAFLSKIADGKTKWFCLLIAAFIHTSVILFIVASFIPALYKRLSLRNLIQLGVICSILFGMLQIISKYNLLKNNYTISYGILRATQLNASTQETVSFGIILLIIIPLLSLIIINYPTSKQDKHPMIPVYNMFILLSIFLFALNNAKLAQYRFFFYTYNFLPIIISYIDNRVNLINKDSYRLCAMAFFIIYFIFTLQSVFSYASAIELLIYPPFAYLLF